jgi:hypothetical protein
MHSPATTLHEKFRARVKYPGRSFALPNANTRDRRRKERERERERERKGCTPTWSPHANRSDPAKRSPAMEAIRANVRASGEEKTGRREGWGGRTGKSRRRRLREREAALLRHDRTHTRAPRAMTPPSLPPPPSPSPLPLPRRQPPPLRVLQPSRAILQLAATSFPAHYPR